MLKLSRISDFGTFHEVKEFANLYFPLNFREILQLTNLSSPRNSRKLKPREFYQIYSIIYEYTACYRHPLHLVSPLSNDTVFLSCGPPPNDLIFIPAMPRLTTASAFSAHAPSISRNISYSFSVIRDLRDSMCFRLTRSFWKTKM